MKNVLDKTAFSVSSTISNIRRKSSKLVIILSLLIPFTVIHAAPDQCFDPILIDDDNNHRIWKIVGANSIDELAGVNLNDGNGIDLVQVGSYSRGYNIQDLAYDDVGQVWGLSMGPNRYAFIGQIIEKNGVYGYENIVNTGHQYGSGDGGKGLVWDPYNKFFIFDAQKGWFDSKTTLKAFDPVTKKLVKKPWSNGGEKLSFKVNKNGATYVQGMAYSPNGTLYAIIGSSPSQLIKLEKDSSNRLTGGYSTVGLPDLGIGANNLESMDFTHDGRLIVIQSNGGNSSNTHPTTGRIFVIDENTGIPTEVASLDTGNPIKRDWEGIKFCNSPPVGRCTSPLNFENPILEAGVKKEEGAIYRFSDVKTNTTSPNVDALLEILNVSNAEIGKIDDTSSGADEALQVEIMLDNSAGNTSAIPDRHIDFEIRFVESGTNTPITVQSIQATAVDIDGRSKVWGDGRTDLTQEYTILSDADTYTFEKNTNLTSPSQGYFIPKNYKNWSGINTDNTEAMVTASYKNTSSIKYTTGIKSTGTSHSTYHRQSSLNFGCLEYDDPETPKTYSISGNVFKDKNTNDIFEASELGFARITVWAQKLNPNGTLDPTKISVETDAQGKYQISTSGIGQFKVFVESTDVDIPVGNTLGGPSPIDVTLTDASSDATDVDFPFDEVLCVAFNGEVSESALVAPNQISGADQVIVPSSSLSPIEGHLRAYKLNSKGISSTTVSWDAANKMNLNKRKKKLYSTDSSGKKTKFKNLKKKSFETSKNQTKTIKKYTLDPSYKSGKYLAGRKKGSFLGGISRGNGITLLTTEIDTFKYLDDNDYQRYYKDHVVKRKERVLVSSDDGFLYNFNYANGNLKWGWMPSSLLPELKSYKNFQTKKLMQGQVNILDLKDKFDNYNPYVIGSYKGGLGHYVLKLNNKGNLKQVVWETDDSSQFTNSPNNGDLDFFTDDKGITYVTYVVNDSSKSTLVVRSITDDRTIRNISLDFKATSTPFVMHNYNKHSAPARKTVYLGDEDGNLYSASLLNADGELQTATLIKKKLEDTTIATLASSSTDPVLFIGSSVSQSDNQYYLRAQSKTQLSVYEYNPSEKEWVKAWSSAIDSSEKTKDDGSIENNPSSIQVLPKGTVITDNAYIVSDSIVLPISVTDASSLSCSGKAYYYLYKLTDGSLPQNTFIKPDDSYINGNIYLGLGKPTRLVLADIPQKDTLAGYGHSDQKDDNSTGVNQTVFIKDSFPTGVRSWRIIDDQEY